MPLMPFVALNRAPFAASRALSPTSLIVSAVFRSALRCCIYTFSPLSKFFVCPRSTPNIGDPAPYHSHFASDAPCCATATGLALSVALSKERTLPTAPTATNSSPIMMHAAANQGASDSVFLLRCSLELIIATSKSDTVQPTGVHYVCRAMAQEDQCLSETTMRILQVSGRVAECQRGTFERS